MDTMNKEQILLEAFWKKFKEAENNPDYFCIEYKSHREEILIHPHDDYYWNLGEIRVKTTMKKSSFFNFLRALTGASNYEESIYVKVRNEKDHRTHNILIENPDPREVDRIRNTLMRDKIRRREEEEKREYESLNSLL